MSTLRCSFTQDTTVVRRIDVFETCLRDPQFGVFEKSSEASIVASEILSVDEKCESFVEG
jgi:hypothetical protein